MITDPFMGDISMFWSYYAPNHCTDLPGLEEVGGRQTEEDSGKVSTSSDGASPRKSRKLRADDAKPAGRDQLVPACYTEALLMLC